MALMLQVTFARACVETRIALDLSQQQVANKVGVSRSYIAKIELGSAHPTLDMAERIAGALGIDIQLVLRPPVFPMGARSRDAVHARCSSYVDRRLRGHGWETAREIEIIHGRSHGWIDVIAFHRSTGTVLIVEIKTELHDLGGLERQLAWYERSVWGAARGLGWRPSRRLSLCLGLASEDVERTVRTHRDLLALSFPIRARRVAELLDHPETLSADARAFALIDPFSRRRDWLIRTSLDGRRSRAPFEDYASALARIRAGRRAP